MWWPLICQVFWDGRLVRQFLFFFCFCFCFKFLFLIIILSFPVLYVRCTYVFNIIPCDAASGNIRRSVTFRSTDCCARYSRMTKVEYVLKIISSGRNQTYIGHLSVQMQNGVGSVDDKNSQNKGTSKWSDNWKYNGFASINKKISDYYWFWD